MSFAYSRRIRFQDADPAGIVFFAHVLSFCHEAYEELLRSEGLPIESLVTGGAPGLPLRHAEVEFTAPMRVGMLVQITVSIGKVSERSFKVDYALRSEQGAELARAATVHVAVDRASMKAIAIPEPLRAALSRHLKS